MTVLKALRLQVSKEWRWFVCPQIQKLMLDMGDEIIFQTPYKTRYLNDHVLNSCGDSGMEFNLENATFYNQVTAYLGQFDTWNKYQICQIALNATAVKFMFKPLLAKSWFFHSHTGREKACEAIVELKSKVNSGRFLIVEHTLQASVCMSLQSDFSLDENITMGEFEVIRVLNDRVFPAHLAVQSLQTA